MRWSARMTACLVRAGPIRCSMRGMLCQLMFMPRPISGTRICASRAMTRKSSDAAADAEALDGADRDLLHLLPGTAQSRSQFEMPAQRTDIHGAARPAFGVLQVEAGAERLGAAGEHHHRRFAVVLETARGVGELTQRLGRQRVDAVAAVEPHHSDTSLGPETLFDRYIVR